MAQLARLEFRVRDATGAPVENASIYILRQGATAKGDQSGSTPWVVEVNAVGGIQIGDSVYKDTGGFSLGSVTGVAEAQLTISTPSGTINDDQRIRVDITTGKASLFNDVASQEALGNPLLTDENGAAACWLAGGYYDVLISGAGITTYLLEDVYASGDYRVSNVLGATGVEVYVFDTTRTIADDLELFVLKNNTVQKFAIRGDGKFAGFGSTAAGTIDAGGLTITAGGLTISADGATIAGDVIFDGATNEDVFMRQKLIFGPSGSEDTNLYRSAANTLKTDDSLIVTGDITINGRLGALSNAESIAANSTISVTKNFVRLTSWTAHIDNIYIDGSPPTSAHDGYHLVLRNVSGVSVTLNDTGNIKARPGAGGAAYSDQQIAELIWDNTSSKWVNKFDGKI